MTIKNSYTDDDMQLSKSMPDQDVLWAKSRKMEKSIRDFLSESGVLQDNPYTRDISLIIASLLNFVEASGAALSGNQCVYSVHLKKHIELHVLPFFLS